MGSLAGPGVLTLCAIFLAVFAGTALQRTSGMGLGLIAAPALSLIIGPISGILLVNVLATINAASNTYAMREHVDWGRFAPIGASLVLGAVPGAFLIRAVSPDLLLVVVGALLLIALSVVTLGDHRVRAGGAVAERDLRGDPTAHLPGQRRAVVHHQGGHRRRSLRRGDHLDLGCRIGGDGAWDRCGHEGGPDGDAPLRT